MTTSAPATALATSTLAARDVHVRLGGSTVLAGVSVRLEPGRLHVLLGPNGAGKSTLLGVLCGDVAIESGSVQLDDRPVADWPALAQARRRAVMLQEHRVAFPFRAVDVVAMGRAPWAGTPQEDDDDQVVAEAMDRTDTTGLADRVHPTLSGGEKARVAFARVLAQTTGILLLDEPTAALDIRHQEEVLAHARRAARQGCAVVVVMHDLTLAAAYADDVTLLERGRVRAHGSPREVLRAETLSSVYGHPITVIDLGEPLGLVVLPHRETTR